MKESTDNLKIGEDGLISEDLDPTLMKMPSWSYWVNAEQFEMAQPIVEKTYQYGSYSVPNENIHFELLMNVPNNWELDGVIDWEGPFRQGSLKIGEIQFLFSWQEGETLRDNSFVNSDSWGVCHVCEPTDTTLIESPENKAGAYWVGDNFIRVIVEGFRLVEYVVDLGDYYTTLYFYLDEQAPQQSLELLDQIVSTMQLHVQ